VALTSSVGLSERSEPVTKSSCKCLVNARTDGAGKMYRKKVGREDGGESRRMRDGNREMGEEKMEKTEGGEEKGGGGGRKGREGGECRWRSSPCLSKPCTQPTEKNCRPVTAPMLDTLCVCVCACVSVCVRVCVCKCVCVCTSRPSPGRGGPVGS
jgi:hypothetical protein